MAYMRKMPITKTNIKVGITFSIMGFGLNTLYMNNENKIVLTNIDHVKIFVEHSICGGNFSLRPKTMELKYS
jgi:hypothetical protein